MNVVFAAGGTGGHLYPALAVAAALKNFAAGARVPMQISFLGNASRLEATLVPQAGYPLSFIAGGPLARKISLQTLSTVFSNAYGVLLSLAALHRKQPDFIIATGGYVSFPVVIAGRLLRALRISCARIVLLEINAYPGLTNRLVAPLVHEVWGSFASAASYFGDKYHRTGVPLRDELTARDRTEAAALLGIDPGKTTILVMGGSQGARSINQAVLELLSRRRLPPDWQIVHVSGERDYDRVRAHQRAMPEHPVTKLLAYAHDMSAAYAACDIVVCRAGASTLAELAATAKPSILVPYPFAAENHQMANAREFAQAGAACILLDSALNSDNLWRLLRGCMEPGKLATMGARARSLAGGNPMREILLRIRALAQRG